MLEDYTKDTAYRVYVTDTLKTIAENTAKYAGGGYPTKRYADVIKPVPVDRRTGEEIAADVIKKCGLKVVI